MANDNEQNDSELKERLAAARLAMSPEEEKKEWQGREDYLRARKKEAALAMVSGEQKAKLEEEAKAREEQLQKQKKLAALELIRKQGEEKKKSQLAEEQKKQDEEAELERVRRIEQIMESKAEIKGLVNQKVGGPRTIHTLSDDIAETVKRDKITASKIIIQEKVMRQTARAEEELKQKKKRSSIVISLSLILVSLGILSVIIVWWQKREEDNQPILANKESLIFADRQIKIDTTNLDRATLQSAQISEYQKLQADPVSGSGISDLYFTKTVQETIDEKVVTKTVILTAGDYLKETTLITDDFSRFVNNDFMVGFLGYNHVSPFFIFKTNNYKYLADAMLLTGKPIIIELFNTFWSEDQKNLSRGSLFKDITLKNYDLRVLKNDLNESVAGYVFLDEKTLLFFETEEDFLKILDAFLIARPTTR